MSMQFTKATRKKARLRLAITGPSGSGKTEGALKVATGLGGKIAAIDTEHDSASLYSDRFDFDSMSLPPPYTPERFIEAIGIAEKAGYNCLIIDSLSHVWNGSGGCLEINDTLAAAKYKGNTWSAWNETTPRYRKLVDRILSSPMHIIATMRSKTETVQGEGKKIIKLGMKAEQRDGLEYEFTTVLDLEHESHMALASKDRTRLFHEPRQLNEDVGQMLLAWLENGETVVDRNTSMLAEIAAATNLDALKVITDRIKAELQAANDGAAWKQIILPAATAKSGQLTTASAEGEEQCAA